MRATDHTCRLCAPLTHEIITTNNQVWDEEKQDWAPRWGYERAKDDTKAWALPVPDNAGVC